RNIRIYTDNIPVMIAYADKNQRLRFTNRPYERMFGIRRIEGHGMAVREAVGEERYVRLEPMIRAVLEGYRQSFEIDFPAPKEGWGGGSGGGNGDGDVRSEREARYAEGTYIPHFDETGEVLGY